MKLSAIRSLSEAVELHIQGKITTEQFQAFKDNHCHACGEAAAVVNNYGQARCAGCHAIEGD